MIVGAKTHLPVDLAGLRVAITGAAGGIGLVMANSFASCGARLFISDVNEAALQECGHPGMIANAGSATEMESVIKAKADAAGIGENAQTERAVATTSLRCFVSQHDIANMALYLCSPFGATISGQAMAVDGDLQVLI
eukprot:gene5498-5553_t